MHLYQEMRNASEDNRTLEAGPDETIEDLRWLAAAFAATVEQERKYIASEVHDELGQTLTVLRMNVSLLRIQFGADNAPLADRIQEITGLIDQAIQKVRNVASNLRLAVLDKGIVSAVKGLSVEFSGYTAIPCTLEVDDENMHLDEMRSVAIFRIVQESLTNVARHANAGSVNISMARQENSLLLSVRDNGRGFDPLAQGNGESFGLHGMRERAIALRGVFEIVSAQGQGTAVSVCIPIPGGPAIS